MILLSPTPDDLDIAARVLDGEAGNQGAHGMAAVAWVILNRATWDEITADHPEREWWGTTIGSVCRKPMQFSCLNGGANTDRIKALLPTSREYQTATVVLRQVIAGSVPDPTGGATTYKVRGTSASWDGAVAAVVPRSIGAHNFWRLSPDGKCLPFLNNATGVANV